MKRNLMVLAAALAFAGCTHETYIVDSKHPEVEYTEAGELKWHNRFIRPEDFGEEAAVVAVAGRGGHGITPLRIQRLPLRTQGELARSA